MTIVVDASVLVAALVDSGNDGLWAESVLAQGSLVGPELVSAEALNILRRLELSPDISRGISRSEAAAAYSDLLQLDLELFPFSPFAQRVWALRDNLTCYDAWYVALAEALDCPLATLDQRLVRSSGPTCHFLAPSHPSPLPPGEV